MQRKNTALEKPVYSHCKNSYTQKCFFKNFNNLDFFFDFSKIVTSRNFEYNNLKESLLKVKTDIVIRVELRHVSLGGTSVTPVEL